MNSLLTEIHVRTNVRETEFTIAGTVPRHARRYLVSYDPATLLACGRRVQVEEFRPAFFFFGKRAWYPAGSISADSFPGNLIVSDLQQHIKYATVTRLQISHD
jgi:hypothetical protein